MACIGSKIIAAPFAYIGSVGVMMPALLNFQKALQSREVDSYEFSAGKSKIGVTPLGKVTEDKLKTTQDSLEKIHRSFKDLIKQARPGVDVEEGLAGRRGPGPGPGGRAGDQRRLPRPPGRRKSCLYDA
eukprot:CAMPEP_0206416448 /NCGR_PEP_ID=MMETSP0294-20121207/36719_1 /ASSEMBLY_ACC=CAM_ASM_000327 /TAXON_ID=39354 /ORGANISM="Heterosigma akashiwo, Strain CCMP2393" /LENGTH=128 /DNA_ID=CAMNT_0053879037 /DNA_START=78 /DNA_END=464 /DNA_ORIENTATION=+